MICGLGKEATRKNAKSWFLLATFGNLFFFQGTSSREKNIHLQTKSKWSIERRDDLEFRRLENKKVSQIQ